MTITTIPANPYHKAHKVTSLRQICIEKQKGPIAKTLGIPYTPVELRPTECRAACCLLQQVETNKVLFDNDNSTKEIQTEKAY